MHHVCFLAILAMSSRDIMAIHVTWITEDLTRVKFN